MDRREFAKILLAVAAIPALPNFDHLRPSPDNAPGRVGNIVKGPIPTSQAYPGLIVDIAGKTYVVDCVDHERDLLRYKELPEGYPRC